MSKKLCIISVITTDFISGNLIDGLDLYYNLRDYFDCDYFILIKTNQMKLLYHKLKTTFNPPVYNDIIQHIRLDNFQIDFDKYDVFIYKYNYYRLNHDITKYNGILLNGWSATRELIYYKNNVFANFKHVATSPFLLKYDKANNYFIYYAKFSKYRLDNIIHSNKEWTFSDYANYEKLKTSQNFSIHDYSKLAYSRHKVDETNFYAEIKGKLIFEFLYFGKQVHYSPKNKVFDDGLTDYLNLFGIDDNIEQDLNISREEVYETLVKFDENDELLSFIKTL